MYYKRLLTLVSLMIFICTTITAQDFKYVGATKCKMCHNKATTGTQYKVWSEGPHANAMKSLSEEEAKDPKCIKCHSTAGSVDAELVESITIEEGVSCESCHGPGSEYRKIMVKKDKALNEANGLIILDEPGAGLDSQRRRWLPEAISGLKSINQVIVVTHMEELKESTERVISLIPQGKGRQPKLEYIE